MSVDSIRVLLSFGEFSQLRIADVFYSNRMMLVFIVDKYVSRLFDCSSVTPCPVYALDKYGPDIDPKVNI